MHLHRDWHREWLCGGVCTDEYGRMRYPKNFVEIGALSTWRMETEESHTDKFHVRMILEVHLHFTIYGWNKSTKCQERRAYAVKVRRHTPWSRVRCHGSHECWFMHSQFHSRRHSLRITLKYTTMVRMRCSYAWTMKSWQRSEWHLGFNSVLTMIVLLCHHTAHTQTRLTRRWFLLSWAMCVSPALSTACVSR